MQVYDVNAEEKAAKTPPGVYMALLSGYMALFECVHGSFETLRDESCECGGEGSKNASCIKICVHMCIWLFRMCIRLFLSVYIFFSGVWLFRMCMRLFLSVCMVLLGVYMALLTVYMSLLSVYMALFECLALSNVHAALFECMHGFFGCIYGSFECVYGSF